MCCHIRRKMLVERQREPWKVQFWPLTNNWWGTLLISRSLDEQKDRSSFLRDGLGTWDIFDDFLIIYLVALFCFSNSSRKCPSLNLFQHSQLQSLILYVNYNDLRNSWRSHFRRDNLVDTENKPQVSFQEKYWNIKDDFTIRMIFTPFLKKKLTHVFNLYAPHFSVQVENIKCPSETDSSSVFASYHNSRVGI